MLERFNSNKGECDIRAKLLMPIERLCVNQGNPWRWGNILVISPGGRPHSWLKYSTLNSFNDFIERILHYTCIFLSPITVWLHFEHPWMACCSVLRRLPSLVLFLLFCAYPFPIFFCLPPTTTVRPRPFRNVIFNFIGGIFNICADYAEMDHRHQFSPVRSSSLQSADIIK